MLNFNQFKPFRHYAENPGIMRIFSVVFTIAAVLRSPLPNRPTATFPGMLPAGRLRFRHIPWPTAKISNGSPPPNFLHRCLSSPLLAKFSPVKGIANGYRYPLEL